MPQTELLIWTQGRRRAGPHRAPRRHPAHHLVGVPALARGAARDARQGDERRARRHARRQCVRVPTPSDTGFATAMRRQREGRFSESATITLERLTDEKLSVNDRRIALMSMANTFQVEDDAPAAAFVANELTAMDPCALERQRTRRVAAAGGQRGVHRTAQRGRDARPHARRRALLRVQARARRCCAASCCRATASTRPGRTSSGSRPPLTAAGAFTVVRVPAVGQQLVLAVSDESLWIRAARLHPGGEPAQQCEQR